MELYTPLPRQLSSSLSREVPNHLINRLFYLWLSAHQMAKFSLNLSHRFSYQFVQLINEFGIQLPTEYHKKICRYCCALQLPSISCRSRIRRRTNLSRCNHQKPTTEGTSAPSLSMGNTKVKGKTQLFKNQLITVCCVCKATRRTPLVGCFKIKKNQQTKNSTSSTASSSATTPLKVEPKKFSFHDSLQKRLSIPVAAKGTLEGDFISLSSSPMVTDIVTGNKRHLNLLEKEHLNKKQKRKSTNSLNTPPAKVFSRPVTPAATTPVYQLGSLQQLLNSNKK